MGAEASDEHKVPMKEGMGAEGSMDPLAFIAASQQALQGDTSSVVLPGIRLQPTLHKPILHLSQYRAQSQDHTIFICVLQHIHQG